jgi:hypothetical protein
MAKLVRKNLMVDEVKLKELARRRGTSESAAVRELVDHALVADEVGEIFTELQRRGGLTDVFDRPSAGDGDGAVDDANLEGTYAEQAAHEVQEAQPAR